MMIEHNVNSTCDVSVPVRESKHILIMNGDDNLSSAITELENLINRIKGTDYYEDPKGNNVQETALVNVLDNLPETLNAKSNQIRRCVSELNELLF